MLSEEVCKRCPRYHKPPEFQVYWQCCWEPPFWNGNRKQSTNVYWKCDPPDDCGFRLEHLLARQELFGAD